VNKNVFRLFILYNDHIIKMFEISNKNGNIILKIDHKNERQFCFEAKNCITYSTMLGCFKFFNRDISLMAVLGTPSSSFSSLIFLIATISPVSVFCALYTTP